MPRKRGKGNINKEKKKDVLKLFKELTKDYAGKARRPNIYKKVAKVLGVCESSVCRIVKEDKTGE